MRFSELAVAFIAALPGITAAASAGTTASNDDSSLKGLRGPTKDTPRRELRMEKKSDIPSWLVPVGQGHCRDGEGGFYDWGIIFYGPHLPLKTFKEAAEKCPRGPWFRGAENESDYCTCLYHDRTGYEGRAKGSVVHNEPEMFAQVWTAGPAKGPVVDANGSENAYCYKYDKGADETAGPNEPTSPKEPAVAPEEQKNNGRGPKVSKGGFGSRKDECSSSDDCPFLLSVVDAAGQQFCNFEDGDSGNCELCSDIQNGCINEGFAHVNGKNECKKVCE